MPLAHSKSKEAFKANVSTLMGEVGKSPHVQSREQALAISYAIKRRGKAGGGKVAGFASGGGVFTGPIMSKVPGRTDNHPMKVKAGSYVLPADHVSSLGQGNTMAGLDKLNKAFKMGPYSGTPKIKAVRGLLRAAGGKTGNTIGKPTPINAAGGEFVIPPEKILEWMAKNGHKPNLDYGHAELDRWVVNNRKEHQKTLATLPGPAQS